MEDKFTISLKAEPVFNIGGFIITNSMLTTVIVVILLTILVATAARNAKLVPGRWQAFWEMLIEFVLNLVEGSLGRKLGRSLFPMLATFFIYILFANWFSLLPFIGTVGYYDAELEVPTDKTVAINTATYAQTNTLIDVTDKAGKKLGEFEGGTMLRLEEKDGTQVKVQEVAAKGHEATKPVEGSPEGYVPLNQLTGAQPYKVLVPFLRAPNADLNMTLAMALISFFTVQFLAVRAHGVGGYAKEYFPNLNPFNLFLGLIEVISQLSRVLSLTLRLFGNVFAGEALLAIIIKIAGPSLIIFIGLELFFGLIQALVFFSLSTVYMTLAVVSSHGDGGHGGADGELHESDSHLTEQAKYPQQSEYIEKEAVGTAR